MMLKVIAEESEGNCVEDGPGGAAANEGATLDATYEDADAEGAGGRHGADKREKVRVSGR